MLNKVYKCVRIYMKSKHKEKKMKIYKGIAELIGKTPIIELSNIERLEGLKGKLLAKLESFNPAGSSKDRVALSMIEEAEKQGILKEDSVIIEPTSGNTGIGLAAIAAVKGLRIILTMPETMSEERIKLLKAYGAEIVLTPGKDGMNGAIKKANELKEEIENSFIPGQFENPSNPQIHFLTTGPEIWEDTEGNIDIFVAGIGTGGTISGVGKFLKSKNPKIKIVAVEPEDSPVLSEGKSGAHGIQGIGAGFIPKTLDTDIYDEIITVATEDAKEMGNIIAKTEGLLVGISSGAAVWAALSLAILPENKGKTILALLPDSGERYLSTDMFKD